jgi:hypothetical protein
MTYVSMERDTLKTPISWIGGTNKRKGDAEGMGVGGVNERGRKRWVGTRRAKE